MATVNNRKDILLLLLYSPAVTDKPNEPIVGRTRLVKMLYLFKKEAMNHFRVGTEINESNFYEFYAWDFGPFSAQIYDDLTFFLLQGYIDSTLSDEESLPESEAEWAEWLSASGTADEEESAGEYRDEAFALTEKGLRFTVPMYKGLSEPQRIHLREFKKRTSSAPLRALLRYVYTNYREDAAMSKIRDQILSSDRY